MIESATVQAGERRHHLRPAKVKPAVCGNEEGEMPRLPLPGEVTANTT